MIRIRRSVSLSRSRFHGRRLKGLKRRDRRIAESLALGNRTTDVAKRFKVCAGRVSQLRRELADSWHKFVGDEPPEAATVPAWPASPVSAYRGASLLPAPASAGSARTCDSSRFPAAEVTASTWPMRNC